MKTILKTRIRASVCIFACIAIGFTCTFKPFFKGIIIDGDSMVPTYVDKEWVLTHKRSYLGRDWIPDRGDIVVVLLADENMCKRVIGLPGDTINIKDGRVYINNSKAPDGYAFGKITFTYETRPGESVENILETTIIVPKGYIWAIGDNRQESWYGVIPLNNVIGRAVW